MKVDLSPLTVPDENQAKMIDKFDIKMPKDMKPISVRGSTELKRCIDLIFLEQHITNVSDFNEAVKYLLKPMLLSSFGVKFTSGYINAGYTKTHYIKAGKEQVLSSPMMDNGKEENLIEFVYFLHGFIRNYFEVVFIIKARIYCSSNEQPHNRGL